MIFEIAGAVTGAIAAAGTIFSWLGGDLQAKDAKRREILDLEYKKTSLGNSNTLRDNAYSSNTLGTDLALSQAKANRTSEYNYKLNSMAQGLLLEKQADTNSAKKLMESTYLGQQQAEAGFMDQQQAGSENLGNLAAANAASGTKQNTLASAIVEEQQGAKLALARMNIDRGVSSAASEVTQIKDKYTSGSAYMNLYDSNRNQITNTFNAANADDQAAHDLADKTAADKKKIEDSQAGTDMTYLDTLLKPLKTAEAKQAERKPQSWLETSSGGVDRPEVKRGTPKTKEQWEKTREEWFGPKKEKKAKPTPGELVAEAIAQKQWKKEEELIRKRRAVE